MEASYKHKGGMRSRPKKIEAQKKYGDSIKLHVAIADEKTSEKAKQFMTKFYALPLDWDGESMAPEVSWATIQKEMQNDAEWIHRFLWRRITPHQSQYYPRLEAQRLTLIKEDGSSDLQDVAVLDMSDHKRRAAERRQKDNNSKREVESSSSDDALLAGGGAASKKVKTKHDEQQPRQQPPPPAAPSAASQSAPPSGAPSGTPAGQQAFEDADALSPRSPGAPDSPSVQAPPISA